MTEGGRLRTVRFRGARPEFRPFVRRSAWCPLSTHCGHSQRIKLDYCGNAKSQGKTSIRGNEVMKIAAMGLVALALTGACAVTSQPTHQLAPNAASNVQSQIAAATAAWNDGLVRKDGSALQAILASEFVLTTNEGENTTSRDEWFRNLQNMTISKIDVRLVDVRTEGNVAVAQMEGEWDVTRNGRRALVPFRGVDSWVFRDGRWQVFRRQMAR